jgi:hypothetical protein
LYKLQLCHRPVTNSLQIRAESQAQTLPNTTATFALSLLCFAELFSLLFKKRIPEGRSATVNQEP